MAGSSAEPRRIPTPTSRPTPERAARAGFAAVKDTAIASAPVTGRHANYHPCNIFVT